MHSAGFANITTSQTRRWSDADRRLHRRRRPLRAARQQADARGDRGLPPAPGRRGRGLAAAAGHRRTGKDRIRRCMAPAGRSRHPAHYGQSSGTGWSTRTLRRASRHRVLPSEPTEHEHEEADGSECWRRSSLQPTCGAARSLPLKADIHSHAATRRVALRASTTGRRYDATT